MTEIPEDVRKLAQEHASRLASHGEQFAKATRIITLAILADRALRPAAVPGWRLVPGEPTEEMLDAGDTARREHTSRYFDGAEVVEDGAINAVYAAMLAAAPAASQAKAGTEELVEALEYELSSLRKLANSLYCRSLDQYSKPACLGWEVKAADGKFGKNEFSAHANANQLMGEHRGIAHSVAVIRAAIAKHGGRS